MAVSIYKERLLMKRRELLAAIQAIDEILEDVKHLPEKETKEKETK